MNNSFFLNYFGCYSSPLIDEEKKPPKNISCTHRREFVNIKKNPTELNSGEYWNTNYIIDKSDHIQMPAT